MSMRAVFLALVLIFVSFVLERMAVHGLLVSMQIPWLYMTIAFLVLNAPQRLGIAAALILGLMLDVEKMQLLGYNMFALVLLVTSLRVMYHRLSLAGWPLIIIAIPTAIMLVRLVGYGALWLIGSPVAFDFWVPYLSLVFVWTLYYAALQLLRIKMNLI